MSEEDEYETCGHPTAADEPCQLPASRDDGRCHMHTSIDPASVGRPTKLSYERQERIATALERGVSFKAACQATGIPPQRGHRWLQRGEEQEEGEFREFHDRITRARGMGKADLSQTIVEIAKDKQDAATLLKYLQHIEGGEASQEDDAMAGLNLVVPDVALRETSDE